MTVWVLEAEGGTADGHTSEEPIHQVTQEILAEMPPGKTVDDILRTCVDDRQTPSESDDEDPVGNSNYLKHQI